MKRKKTKKLLLSTERVRDLRPGQMKRAAGGLCAGTYDTGGDTGGGGTDPAGGTDPDTYTIPTRCANSGGVA